MHQHNVTLPYPAHYVLGGEFEPAALLTSARAAHSVGCQSCYEQLLWIADLQTVGREGDARDFDLMVGLYAYSLSNASPRSWHRTLAFVGMEAR